MSCDPCYVHWSVQWSNFPCSSDSFCIHGLFPYVVPWCFASSFLVFPVSIPISISCYFPLSFLVSIRACFFAVSFPRRLSRFLPYLFFLFFPVNFPMSFRSCLYRPLLARYAARFLFLSVPVDFLIYAPLYFTFFGFIFCLRFAIPL